MSDFGNATYPVGRKDYCCEWCGENIPRGEKRFHFFGVWEGVMQNWRMHLECNEDANNSDATIDGFIPLEHARPGE